MAASNVVVLVVWGVPSGGSAEELAGLQIRMSVVLHRSAVTAELSTSVLHNVQDVAVCFSSKLQLTNVCQKLTLATSVLCAPASSNNETSTCDADGVTIR